MYTKKETVCCNCWSLVSTDSFDVKEVESNIDDNPLNLIVSSETDSINFEVVLTNVEEDKTEDNMNNDEPLVLSQNTSQILPLTPLKKIRFTRKPFNDQFL